MTHAVEPLIDRLGEAAPYIEICDGIDSVVATLRVVWLALKSREWLDDVHVEHCADCLDRAAKDLTGARAVADSKAIEIYERALAATKDS